MSQFQNPWAKGGALYKLQQEKQKLQDSINELLNSNALHEGSVQENGKFQNPWAKGGALYPDYLEKDKEKLFENNDKVLGNETLQSDNYNEDTLLDIPFNELEVSWRITDEKNSQFLVYLKPNIPMLYDEVDEQYEEGLKGNAIYLPEGARVIKLYPNANYPEYIKTVFFWKNRYREGYLNADAFSKGYFNRQNKYASEIFITDLERLIKNIEQWEVNLSEYPVIQKAYETVEAFLYDRKYNLSSKELNSAISLFYSDVKFKGKDNEVNWFINDIMEFLKPGIESFWNESNILIIPFCSDFFVKNKIISVQGEYIKIIDPLYEEYSNLLFEFDTNTGSVKFDNNLDDIRSLFNKIYENLDSFVPSIEVDWLKNENNKNLINNCDTIIIIGTRGLWDDNVKAYYKNKYASLVAIETSIASLGALAIMTTVLHESNENIRYFPGDSHCNPLDATGAVFKYLKTNKFTPYFSSEKVAGNPAKYYKRVGPDIRDEGSIVDYLYQSNTYITFVFASCFIKKYLS